MKTTTRRLLLAAALCLGAATGVHANSFMLSPDAPTLQELAAEVTKLENRLEGMLSGAELRKFRAERLKPEPPRTHCSDACMHTRLTQRQAELQQRIHRLEVRKAPKLTDDDMLCNRRVCP